MVSLTIKIIHSKERFVKQNARLKAEFKETMMAIDGHISCAIILSIVGLIEQKEG